MTVAVALLLLAQQPTIAVPEPAANEEIVVIARKLATSRFTWKADDDSGTWKLKKCKVKKSSGDKEIDAIVCAALGRCVTTLPAKAKQLSPAFHSCVTDTRRALIQDLADKRAGGV